MPRKSSHSAAASVQAYHLRRSGYQPVGGSKIPPELAKPIPARELAREAQELYRERGLEVPSQELIITHNGDRPRQKRGA
jgi:hypothetical protein